MNISMMETYGTEQCFTGCLHFSTNHWAIKRFFLPTQLHLPHICTSSIKIEVSICHHWSLPSTHTALPLLHNTSALYWPFWIHSLSISLTKFFFTALCTTTSQSCILSASRFSVGQKTKQVTRPECERRKNARLRRGYSKEQWRKILF